MKKKNLLVILSVTLFISLACNIGNTATPNNNTVATSVALTLEAGEPIPPTVPLPTMPPAIPPTAVFTLTIALTATPSVPMVSVSEDTNCRTGPSKAYDQIGALMSNETAEVVGKNTPSDYWIIKNPDRNGNCWLWGYYATVAGNTANLQEYAVPPTPTPVPTATPTGPNGPQNLTILNQVCSVLTLPNYAFIFTLTWDDNSLDEDGFHLYRDGVLISVVPANQNIEAITGNAISGVPMQFGVSAFNGAGESAITTIQGMCP